MQQARPSPADVLGLCAYLFAMNGGVAGRELVSELAFSLRALRDGYTIEQIPVETENELAIPLPHPPEPDEEPAPVFTLSAIELAKVLAPNTS